MSSSHPPTFENYPEPPPEHATPEPADQLRVEPTGWTPLVSAPPPPKPSPWPSLSRRNVMQVTGVGVAGIVGLSLLANQRGSGSEWPGGEPSQFGTDGGDPDDTDGGRSVNVGDYTVDFPKGWTITDQTDDTALLSNGATTMLFRAYQAGDDATAVDEASRLLKKYAADLRRPGTVQTREESTTDLEVAAATRSGTIGAEPGQAEAWVAISREAEEALAMITLVPDAAPSKVKREVVTTRNLFLDQLG